MFIVIQITSSLTDFFFFFGLLVLLVPKKSQLKSPTIIGDFSFLFQARQFFALYVFSQCYQCIQIKHFSFYFYVVSLYSSVSQLRHYCAQGRIVLFHGRGGALLCAVGCLGVPLFSVHQMPVASPPSVMKVKNISRLPNVHWSAKSLLADSHSSMVMVCALKSILSVP